MLSSKDIKTLTEKYGFSCNNYEDAKRIQNENKR